MKLLILLFSFQLLFGATPEQIEEYISVSSAEEELLQLQSEFSAMQNGFSQDANTTEETYDMQLLTVRFKEYLERSLSESEMDEILQNYKSVIYLQFVSNMMYVPDKNETDAYLFTLEEDETLKERLNILEDISKTLNKEKSMAVMFDELMLPLLQSAQGANTLNEDMLKQRRSAYLKSMADNARKDTLFNLKDFSIEELEALREVVKTSAMDHETKAVYGATAYALKEFFLSLASRYDVTKHDPNKYNKSTTDRNNTK